MSEDQLPAPLGAAVTIIRSERDPKARVDAVASNFAYIWVHGLRNPTGEETDLDVGGWLRIPLAFPQATPWGLVTRKALPGKDGRPNPDGHNPGHENAAPVRPLGGDHYYSWTWSESPPLRQPENILEVIRWYERRIRLGLPNSTSR